MSDDVNTLATEYYDFRHRVAPTSAHLDGDYRFAASFERYSRAAEDAEIDENRRFAREALVLDADGLGPEDRISRDMMAWDATARADLAEVAAGRVRREPDLRPAGNAARPNPQAVDALNRGRRGHDRPSCVASGRPSGRWPIASGKGSRRSARRPRLPSNRPSSSSMPGWRRRSRKTPS